MMRIVVLVTLLVCVQFAHSALQCGQCVCVGLTMNCRGIGLTSLPTFDPSIGSYIRVDLGNNSITSIGAYKFGNLHSVQELDLSYNHISTIDPHAFSLVSNITNLNLRGNNLNNMPNLLELKKLRILDISENPIPHTNFNDAVMRTLGSTLEEFHFGHRTVLTSWPRATDHLQRLETLDLNGALMAFIPPQSFHGFENRLRSLTIQYTQLTATPILSTLRVLEELHLDHNNFGDYGVLEATFSTLTHLRTLSLRYDKLTQFPDILKNLGNVRDLSLDGNKFYYIGDAAINILKGTHITDLSLKNCGLDRVPGAIAGRNLNRLQNLDLADNNIISIERSDLDGLDNLVNVSFANNPLRYISTESLQNLTSLTFLDMSNTDLVIIPQALGNLPGLHTVSFEGDQIECNCNLIAFQKLQHARGFQVTGQCETIDVSIIDYLRRFIPNCPDYT